MGITTGQEIMKNIQTTLLFLLGGALLLLFVALSSAPLVLSPDYFGNRIWRNYTLLGLEGSTLKPELADSIAALKGMEALVCEQSATVSFNTFNGFEQVSVADLENRLESFDPRRDPYINNLSRYFRGERRGEPWQILYLKSRSHPGILRRRLAAVLAPEGRAWRLPESGGAQKLLLIAAFAGAALLVLAGRRGPSRTLALLSLVPWLPRLAAGGPLDLYSFFLLYPLWVFLAESGYAYLYDRVVLGWRADTDNRLRLQALLLAAGFLLAALLFLRPGGEDGPAQRAAAWYLQQANLLGKNSVSLAANLLLLPLAAVRLRYSRANHFHTVFQPLPIRKAPRRMSQRRLPVASLLLLAAVSFPLLLLVTESGGLTAPRPLVPGPIEPWPAGQSSTGATGGLTWKGIRALSRHESIGGQSATGQSAIGQSAIGQSATGQSATGQSAIGQSAEYLPDLADYLSHRAFQEGLAFGRPYGLPSPGERITLSYYLVLPDSREVVKTQRVVKRYQSAWLEQTLEKIKPGDVEGLLVAQGAMLHVVSQPEDVILRLVFPPVKQLLFLFFLLITVLVTDFYLTASVLYGMRNLLIRRNQHAV
jgi:hypothetical protein